MTTQPVDILIITAADGEDDAVRAVDDGASGEWAKAPLDGPRFPPQRYGTQPPRPVRKMDMGL